MDAQTADNWALQILIGAPIAAYVIARVFALRSLPTLALGVMLAAAGGFVIDGYLLRPVDLPYGFGLGALQVPLSAIAAFVVWRVRAKRAPAVTPEPVSPALASANRRIVARCVDAMVGFVGAFALILLLDELADNSPFNAILGFFATMLLDAPCTKLWGRTPGKVLLGLRVVSTDGSPISWSRAWQRAVLVWAKGLCLGIPLLFLVTSAVAMRRVVRTGRASWDEATQTNVVRSRAA